MDKIKSYIKFFKSTKVIISGGIFLLVLIAITSYLSISSPKIDDGYTANEIRRVTYNAPLQIRFSQSMNKNSVEANFSVKPSLKGKFNWSSSKVLQYIPEKTLNVKDKYQVIIKSSAKNIYLKKLDDDLKLNFVVTGAPYAKFISPMENPVGDPIGDSMGVTKKSSGFTEGVSTKSSSPLIIPNNQVVTVMFDRPMRALTTLDESSANQKFPKLEINPIVKGSYRWVGTTTFQFIPEKWTMGTTYTLKLPKGITALDGGKTEKDVIWKLATEAPKIVSSIPTESDDTFYPKGNIILVFNQPIELGDVKPGLNALLYPSNDVDSNKILKKDGFFNTEVTYGKDKDGNIDKKILNFKPTFDYQYNTSYKFIIKPGLKNLDYKKGYGDLAMKKEFILNFKTVKKPGVVSFAPKNGDQNYSKEYINIYFASPMTKELIKKYINISPKPKGEPEIYVHESSDTTGTIWDVDIDYNLEPSTKYTFEFKGPFKDSLGNEAVKGFKTSFKTAPLDSYLGLLTRNNFGMFMSGLDPIYPLKTINIKNVDIEVCEVGEQEFFTANGNYSWYNYNCTNPLKKTIAVNGQLNKSHFLNLNLRELFNKSFKQGIYYFQISSNEYLDYKTSPRRFHQTFFISDTNLTLKKSNQDLLVWATDIKTGKPVPYMDLQVLSNGGSKLASGKTDKNGVYKISKKFDNQIYVVGKSGSRWSMVGEYWNEGIESWQYDLRGEWVTADEPRIYLYTERPLYKPGDDIYFKGIYRMDNDLDLSLPKDKKISLILEDPEYNEIESKYVSLLSDGSFDGSFKLSSKVKVGRYNLYAKVSETKFSQRFYHSFFVEEYKKPKFKVAILGSNIDYKVGDEIAVDLKANYYFGGAIKDGEVSWTLMREPYMFNGYKGSGYYSFGKWTGFSCYWYTCTSSSETVKEGKGVLDKSGSLKLKLPTVKKEVGQSYLYTLNATVTNKDGEIVNNRETFMVHQGSYYIGLNVKNYIVSPNNDLELNVITIDPKSKVVNGKKVTLELYKEKWNTVKKRGVDGSFYDESVKELVFVKKNTVTTDSDPVISKFSIDSSMSGSYVIYGKSQDGNNEIMSETNFYVSSGNWVNWGSSNNNRMELVTDQPQYYVGGKAKILIKSPFGSAKEPAKALVTYERGAIKHYEVIDIKSNSDTIEIPIKEDMIPNVYVTVLVVKGLGEDFDKFIAFQNKGNLDSKKDTINSQIKKLEQEVKNLEGSTPISNRNQILISKNKIELSNLKQDLDNVTSSIAKTKSSFVAGAADYNLIKPDFKFGVVNLAVSKRDREILISLKTNKNSYKVGEEVEIEITTKDYQNRPIPSVVSLAVVDESLLALKANKKVSPLDYFYGPRALQVSTSASLSIHVDRINVASKGGAKGGGGGDSDQFNKKRGSFKDTAYFNPVIKTDGGGSAKIKFKPPDNLTTWEMWAVATSSTDKFGMKKEDFVVKKPIAITSILPNFVISGDQLTVGALVHNQSGKDVKTKVELKADGFDIKGGSKKSVSIKDGESTKINWDITVKTVNTDSTLIVDFISPQDTVQYKLPVSTFSFPEVVATNGTVKDKYSEAVKIPSTLAKDMGGLNLRVGGSLLTKFVKQFKILQDYPYGCAEQITSKILPTLVLEYQSGKQKDADLFKLLNLDKDKNEKIVKDTLQKLSKFQRFDGGYGFWEGSNKSYPMLTSYILYTQHLATKSGYIVGSNNFNLTTQYLWKSLNDKSTYELSLDDRAFALWVLSEIGKGDTGMTLALYEKRKGLSLYAQSLMLMNLDNLYNNGQKSVKSFISKLKAEIVSRQIVHDRTIHFEETTNSWWDLNTDRRTTAMVLMALNRDDTNNPILPNIVNYLTTSKTKQHFINSQETAWMLMSVLEYADSQSILTADFKFDTKLNTKSVLAGQITKSNLSQVFEKMIPLNTLRTGNDLNTVNFEKTGDGQMIYDMELEYYLPNETIKPIEKGFQITRNYYDFESNSTTPTKAFTSGKVYRGELNIIVPEDMYYAVVEERLPAGFEAVNFNLDTADTSLKQKLANQTQKEDENYWYDNPLWYFNHKETRNDRVLLFADYLPKGVYTYNFLVRTGLPGKYNHLPASAYQMYFPEVFGRTEGEYIEIK